MARIGTSMIDLKKYERYYPTRSQNEAWNEVRRFRKVTQEEGYRDIWICKHCNETRVGNVGRVEAHLAGIKVKGVTGCLKVPPGVKEKMTRAVREKDVDTRENKRRNPPPYALQSKSSDEVSPGSAEMGEWSSANPHDIRTS